MKFNHLLIAMQRNKYQVYEEPWRLNIVGVRSKSVRSNAFDDTLVVFYKDDQQVWQVTSFPVTTDPGTFFLDNPLHPEGTALLSEGQYTNAYEIGLHRGKYPALVQVRPVKVLRQYRRRGLPRWNNGRPDIGMFGINIHRAAALGSTYDVDKYSAGCTVFKNATDYWVFLGMCDKHRQRHGNTFTYTLLDFRAIRRAITGQILGATALGLAGFTAYKLY